MGRIAKKPRGVKGSKKAKQPSPPRFTIKRDSLNRRYALDKRTGKRVSVLKAEKELAKRKKAKQAKPPAFRGIKPSKSKAKAPKAPKAKSPKLPKPPVVKKPRVKKPSKVKSAPPLPIAARPFRGADSPPPMPIVPPGERMHILGGIADRAELYPKVKAAATEAWYILQRDAMSRKLAGIQGVKPEVLVTKMDALHGKGMSEFIRYEVFTRALELADIDELVEKILDDDEYDFSARELYTLYFSPEVA
jgi:hypothetical protein